MKHLFIATDGDLYDTNVKDWSKLPPLRNNYKYHHAAINSMADFKATLRAGPYAWPGGYPLYFICEDSEPLCFKCGREEAKSVMEAIKDHKPNTTRNGWRVLACKINYEEDMQCANCNGKIDSAYGEE